MVSNIKVSLSQKVYDLVIEDIITGQLNQDVVITENFLMARYEISKAPVREALIRLCNEDIFVNIPRYGYVVKIVDKAYLEGIIRFRFNMEPNYLEKNFDKITPQDITRIESKIVTMDKDEFMTPFEYWSKTTLFHLELAYSYRDKFFYDMLESILHKQLITFSKLYWDNWSLIIDSKLTDNHVDILNAIKKGNKYEAVLMLQKDIKSF